MTAVTHTEREGWRDGKRGRKENRREEERVSWAAERQEGPVLFNAERIKVAGVNVGVLRAVHTEMGALQSTEHEKPSGVYVTSFHVSV